jgi:cyclopentanol dehydrogenase
MGRLDGKVAIISGAASGMGAVEAKLFAAEGASVVLGDIQDEMGKAVEKEIGKDAAYLRLDVTDETDWVRAVETAVRRFGKLNVLVNNAGTAGRAPFAMLEEQSEEDWDRVMGVNSTGTFLGIKHAVPEMRKAGGGSIINISSVYGLVGSASGAAYPASKGAVRILSKSAAVQYAKEGIRVNSVHPGFIETPQSASLMNDPVARQKLVDRTPIGRIGTSEDIAYGVLFLASDESSYITGAELVLDGGITAE